MPPSLRRFTFAVLLTSLTSMSAQDVRFVNELETEGISLFRLGDPEFQTAITQILSPGDSDKIGGLLPYALVVRNDTGVFLMSVTVLYSFPSPVQAGKTVRNRIASMTQVADRALMLPPGDSLLVTPVGDIGGTVDSRGQRRRFPIITDSSMFLIERQIKFYRDKAITVSIDSLLFEDGALVGPDSGELETYVNANRRAEIELYSKIVQLRGPDLKAYLNEAAAPNLEQNDPYGRRRQLISEFLLREIEHSSEEKILKNVRETAAVRKQFPEIRRRRTQ